MRKIMLSVILTAAVVGTMVSGCGSKAAPQGGNLVRPAYGGSLALEQTV